MRFIFCQWAYADMEGVRIYVSFPLGSSSMYSKSNNAIAERLLRFYNGSG